MVKVLINNTQPWGGLTFLQAPPVSSTLLEGDGWRHRGPCEYRKSHAEPTWNARAEMTSLEGMQVRSADEECRLRAWSSQLLLVASFLYCVHSSLLLHGVRHPLAV